MNIGGSTIAYMISRFNENRSKLSKRPDAKSRARERMKEGFRNSRTNVYRADITPETLAKVKMQIREQYRKEKIRNIKVTVFSVVATIAICTLVYLYFTGILRNWFFPELTP